MAYRHDIEPKADKFLQKKIYEMIYFYIKGEDYQQLFNSFRGNLEAFFHLEMITVEKYIFLMNFTRWLEHKGEFEGREDEVFHNFYDIYVKDLDRHYNNRG